MTTFFSYLSFFFLQSFMQVVSVYFSKPCPTPSYHSSQFFVFFLFFGKKIHNALCQIEHNEENTLTTHLETGLIVIFTEKILWIISLILKIFLLLPPGSCGGPDANLKLDITKLDSHITIIKCIIFVFSDTLKIYDKKSKLSDWQPFEIFSERTRKIAKNGVFC